MAVLSCIIRVLTSPSSRLQFADTPTVLPSRKVESLLAPGSRTLVHQLKRAQSAGQLTHRLAVFRTSDGRGWVSTAAPHPREWRRV